jgi:hypothetical protein
MPKQIRRKGGYVRKWEEVLSSPAYRNLKPVDRCVLEELQRVYRPNRNGQLSLSVRNAEKLVHANKDTITKAFDNLAAHGFIELVRGEYWQEGKAREWRLTFEPCSGREPTDEWRAWQPGKIIFSTPKRKKTRSQTRGRQCPSEPDSPSERKGHSSTQPAKHKLAAI